MFKSTLLLQAHGRDFEHFPADVEPARTGPGPPTCASSRLELLPSPGGTWAAPGPLLRQAASEGTQPADPGIPARPKGLVPVPREVLAAAGWQAVPCPATGTRLSPSLSGHTATKPGPSDSSHVSTSCSDQKKQLRGDPFSQLPACLCEELQLRLSSARTPAGRRGTRAVRRSFAFVFHGQQLRLPRPCSHHPSC